jgi:hypothetical protein
MKLRYLVADANGQLRLASQSAIAALWDGARRADRLQCPNGNELRLVSVVCDNELTPQRIYVLRLPLEDGWFTLPSLLTLAAFSRRDCVTAGELVRHHTAGWPANFFQQLAVALDVPLRDLAVPLGVGGPLLVAAARRVRPEQALRYLR